MSWNHYWPRKNEPQLHRSYKPPYLEFKGKLPGNEEESARTVSLAEGPTIALLLTALVQLAG